jgi:50S ribosomal subunit-associated GTPase HflX
MDKIKDKGAISGLCQRYPDAVMVSALTHSGCEDLNDSIEKFLARTETTLNIAVPFHLGDARAWLHEHGHILKTQKNEEATEECFLVVLSEANKARFLSRWPELFENRLAKH